MSARHEYRAMQPRPDPPAFLGMQLRAARMALHLRQRDVADRIGCSQATVSRLELGRGAGYSLALWSSVAIAVDQRLQVELLAPQPEPPPPSLALRCHRTVVAAARQGGWAAQTEVVRAGARERIETLLDRGPERVLVHVWDVVADVDRRLDQFEEDLERHRQPGPGPTPAGLVIVPSTFGNRRRLTEARAALDRRLSALGAHWFSALLDPTGRIPEKPGVLWVDRSGRRLLPALLVPGWAWTAPDRASRALKRRRS
ncbi:MAG: helix-turn-helix domain-containing protein [Chloroflexota bacterium]